MRIVLLFSILLTSLASATSVDFVRDVRPIFEKHCYECHSETKKKSGLRLDLKEAALKGGDNHGPDIVPGRATESPLIQFITTDDEDEIMPPDGRMSAAEIDTLTRWVQEGAVWPDGVDVVKKENRLDHWSFKPLANRDQGRRETTIDAFIDEKLGEKGLQRSAPVDPVSLIRRLSFDLTGLPPSPERVQSFVAECRDGSTFTVRDEALKELVDELLASSRYGERWAQHWLDVVRYADTHGFEVNTERPNAWPYRDYVIRAFNNDTPYDRFIKEQIVGDATGEDAATGFLVTASVLLPGQIGKDEPSKRLARQDSLDEIVMNIGQTFLGLSVGCARCHDHKFDPISAKDYYEMQAFVAGVEYGDRELRTPEAIAAREELKKLRTEMADLDKQLASFVPLAKSGVTRPMIDARENRDRFVPVKVTRLRFTIRETNNLEPCIDELEVFNTSGDNIAPGSKVASSGDITVADRHELRFLNDGHYGNSRSWMSNEKGKGWVTLEFSQAEEIDRVVWGRDREGKFRDRLATQYVIEVSSTPDQWRTVADSGDRQPFGKRNDALPAFSTNGLSKEEAIEAGRLMAQKRKIESQSRRADTEQKAFAGTFRQPDDIHLLNRGDPEQPTERVVPAVLSSLDKLELSRETPEQQRRMALADWIASSKNTLTARVMVNRIWQGHFGVGLVETASDFGRSGMMPSHPELLDWLAAEFIRSGWSVKHLHRLIVMSDTYRQGSYSAEQEKAQDLDADIRLLWRHPSRRLDAESIRDAMLATSGQLDVKMYGRGFDLFDKRGGLSGFKPVESFTGDGLRRMIYAHKVRREREAVFGAFDSPDAGQSTARRRESTTPVQALNLFNSRFTLDQSEAFAARVGKESGNDARAGVERAYELALSRKPTAEEFREAEPMVREHGLGVLCRALFNSNEFLFVP